MKKTKVLAILLAANDVRILHQGTRGDREDP